MPVVVDGQKYFRTAEVCLMVGICKTTLFRWIREGIINEAENRDRRGWRLFTENEVAALIKEANGVSKTAYTKY